MSGVQLFFSISSLEFSSQAYSTAVLVDLQLNMLAAAFYSCSSKYIFLNVFPSSYSKFLRGRNNNSLAPTQTSIFS
jgi:hypothetical protein